MPTNTIVTYEGGHYEGCSWEANAFMFDWKGEVIDLGSTGRNGIGDNREAALNKWGEIDTGTSRDLYGDIYGVFNVTQMKALCKSTASMYLYTFIKKALAHYENAPAEIIKQLVLGWYCDKCDYREAEIYQVHFVDVKSFGGIMIGTNSMICQQCFDDGACQKCVDGGLDDSHAYSPEETARNHGLCDDCYDQNIIDLLAEKRIRTTPKTEMLLELQAVIDLGEQHAMTKLKNDNYDHTSYDQWRTNKFRVHDEMVKMWKTFERPEREALTID